VVRQATRGHWLKKGLAEKLVSGREVEPKGGGSQKTTAPSGCGAEGKEGENSGHQTGPLSEETQPEKGDEGGGQNENGAPDKGTRANVNGKGRESKGKGRRPLTVKERNEKWVLRAQQ